MSDEFIPISELSPKTTVVNSDKVHTRSTGGLDTWTSVLNFFKSGIDAILGTLTINTKIQTDLVEEKTASAGIQFSNVINTTKGISPSIRFTGAVQLNTVYDALVAAGICPNTGNKAEVNGGLGTIAAPGSQDFLIASEIERTSATTIQIHTLQLLFTAGSMVNLQVGIVTMTTLTTTQYTFEMTL